MKKIYFDFKPTNEAIQHLKFYYTLPETSDEIGPYPKLDLGCENNGYFHNSCGDVFLDNTHGVVARLDNQYINENLIGKKQKAIIRLTSGAIDEYKEAETILKQLKTSIIAAEIESLNSNDEITLIWTTTGYGPVAWLKNDKLSHFAESKFESDILKLKELGNVIWVNDDPFADSTTLKVKMTYGEYLKLIDEFVKPVIQKRLEDEQQEKLKKEQIKNGCLFFICESRPHNEDLAGVLLNSPAPNSGAYLLEHKVSNELWNTHIKPYATYYNADFLEECDMFYSEPGWRIGKQALESLKNAGYRIFVDNIENG